MTARAERLPATARRDGKVAGALRRFVKAIEPWYDWGLYHVERMDGARCDSASGVGTVRYFEIQWLGVHLHVQIGRTPKPVLS
jgi:hypothetical protein